MNASLAYFTLIPSKVYLIAKWKNSVPVCWYPDAEVDVKRRLTILSQYAMMTPLHNRHNTQKGAGMNCKLHHIAVNERLKKGDPSKVRE